MTDQTQEAAQPPGVIPRNILDVLDDAGFTPEQWLALARVVNHLTESDNETLRLINRMMDRLKPECWL